MKCYLSYWISFEKIFNGNNFTIFAFNKICFRFFFNILTETCCHITYNIQVLLRFHFRTFVVSMEYLHKKLLLEWGKSKMKWVIYWNKRLNNFNKISNDFSCDDGAQKTHIHKKTRSEYIFVDWKNIYFWNIKISCLQSRIYLVDLCRTCRQNWMHSLVSRFFFMFFNHFHLRSIWEF